MARGAKRRFGARQYDANVANLVLLCEWRISSSSGANSDVRYLDLEG